MSLPPLPSSPGASGSLRWLGHATVLVELDGTRILTDPLLRPRVVHLRRAAPLDAGALDALDAVLISHVHYDHLDPPSLRRLSRESAVVAPRGTGRLLRRIGFRTVVELAAGDETRVGPVLVRAVPAAHSASRLLGKGTPSLGYVLEGSQHLYFLGDTDLFPEMAGLAPGLDVALVPISGWGPKVGPGHLDPRRAAEALARLRPRIAVPIHWGTYYPLTSPGLARPERLAAPAEEFVRAAAEVAPSVAVRVLEVGGRLGLGRESPG